MGRLRSSHLTACFLRVVQQKVVGPEPGAEGERKKRWPWRQGVGVGGLGEGVDY